MAVGAAPAPEPHAVAPIRARPVRLTLGNTAGAGSVQARALAADRAGVLARPEPAAAERLAQGHGAELRDQHGRVVVRTGAGSGRRRQGASLAEAGAVFSILGHIRAVEGATPLRIPRSRERRARRVRAQVGKRLDTAQRVQPTVRTVGEFQGRPVAALPAQGAELARRTTPRLGEVDGGSAAQAPAVGIGRDSRRQVDGRGGRRVLDDVDLPVLALSDRAVFKAHVVGQDVDGTPLLGRDAAGENDDLAGRIAPEERQLGVEAQRVRVVEVDVTCTTASALAASRRVEITPRCAAQGLAAPRLVGRGEQLTQRRVPGPCRVGSIQRMHRRLGMQRHGLVLLLELAALLPLFPLDPLPLVLGQHLLVLDPQLPSLHLVAVEPLDDGLRVEGALEVGKSEAAEDAVVEVVVEGIRLGKAQVRHDLGEHLFPHVERDVLDDDGRRDQVVAQRLGLVPGVVEARRIAVALVSEGAVAVEEVHGCRVEVGNARILGRGRGEGGLASKSGLLGHGPLLEATREKRSAMMVLGSAQVDKEEDKLERGKKEKKKKRKGKRREAGGQQTVGIAARRAAAPGRSLLSPMAPDTVLAPEL